MRIILAKNWWSLVIRGTAAILLGIITFVWPGITLGALVLLFGTFALIDGLLSLAGVLRAAEAHERWGALLFEGLAGIAVAVITLVWPAITALSLVPLRAPWRLRFGLAYMLSSLAFPSRQQRL